MISELDWVLVFIDSRVSPPSTPNPALFHVTCPRYLPDTLVPDTCVPDTCLIWQAISRKDTLLSKDRVMPFFKVHGLKSDW